MATAWLLSEEHSDTGEAVIATSTPLPVLSLHSRKHLAG